MELRISLSDLDYGPEEEEAVLDVIRRKWLTMGSVTQQFEKEFAELCRCQYALGVGNATQALHLACLALGIGPGDEVIVPSLTFVATSNAVLYTGAEVRFADIIGPEDLTISPESIEQQITPRTKAIIVMHYAGYPCRMPEIMAIAEKHGLKVIEDTAHAPGAELDGKALGTWGEVGCFSFFSNKNLATGEGGMLTTNSPEVAEKLKVLRSHGMTTLTWDRHHGHAFSYDVTDLGYNDRIDEIHSALGLAQLHKLERNNARRKTLTEHYQLGFHQAEAGITVPFVGCAGQPAYHIMPVLLPEGTDRNAFMEKMRDMGIQTSIHYPPIHHFKYYQERYPNIHLPVTEAVGAREVTLPLYPTLTKEQVDLVIKSACEALELQHA